MRPSYSRHSFGKPEEKTRVNGRPTAEHTVNTVKNAAPWFGHGGGVTVVWPLPALRFGRVMPSAQRSLVRHLMYDAYDRPASKAFFRPRRSSPIEPLPNTATISVRAEPFATLSRDFLRLT